MKLDELLFRWRAGKLSPKELAELTRLLEAPEARAALRDDWFLEATLLEALKAASVAQRVPEIVAPPEMLRRVQCWWRELQTGWRWAFASAFAILCVVTMLGLWRLSADRGAFLAGELASVTVERGGQSQTAIARMALHDGDIIHAGAAGRATIQFSGEATRLQLEPDTTVSVLSVQSPKRFKLVTGRVNAEVARQRAGAMVWVTDNAEARVLGTKFALAADGLFTRLDVTEGAVELVRPGASEPAVVRAGQFAATDSQSFLTARPIADADSTNLWNVPGRTTPGFIHETFRSEVGGLDVGVNVLLPPGYDAFPQRRYPVLYFLHGFGGDEHTEAARFGPVFWAAMERGDLPPFIAVFPNGGPGFTPKPMVVGQMFSRELSRFIDDRYRTRLGRNARTICGLGYGAHRAIILATLHSDVYGGGCALDDSLRGGNPAFQRLLQNLHFRMDRFGARLLLLHGARYPAEHAESLATFLRSLDVQLESRPLTAQVPWEAAYPEAAFREMIPALQEQWQGQSRPVVDPNAK